MRVRVVNVVDLFRLQSTRDHPHGLADRDFEACSARACRSCSRSTAIRTSSTSRSITVRAPQRFHVRGYVEEGTTTTPFDMTVLNGMSRHHLALMR